VVKEFWKSVHLCRSNIKHQGLTFLKHGVLFLVNMLLRVGFSRCLQALVHWSGFHAARGDSEWCILLWLVHITVTCCCSNIWCRTSFQLLATFTVQHSTRAQEQYAGVTLNTPDFAAASGLPTSDVRLLVLGLVLKSLALGLCSSLWPWPWPCAHVLGLGLVLKSLALALCSSLWPWPWPCS